VVVARSTAVTAAGATVTVADPTVTATFAASPTSGTSPLSSTLTTTVTGGTATGNITYSVWYNCNSACATVAACTTACGAVSLSITQAGTTYAPVNSYTTGTYYPRVVVARSTAVTAAGATVTVAAPTITVTFTASPDSGTEPVVSTLTTTVTGGNTTGNITYSVWYNCDSACATVAACTTACGAVSISITQAGTTYAPNNSYSAGTYYPRVVAVRGSAVTAAGDVVTIESSDEEPTVTDETAMSTLDYCNDPPNAIFSWTFNDAESLPQLAYQIQIINETKTDFSSPSVDSGKIYETNDSWGTVTGQLGYNHTYRWRVMVWDAADQGSDWVEGGSFSTPEHRYPAVSFNRYPSMIPVDGKMQFFDTSVDYSSGGIQSRSWEFESGAPATSIEKNPFVTFASKGDNTVTLTITDSDGYKCAGSKVIRTLMRLPVWEEVPPE